VRRWVPELARMPDEFIHRPWQASALIKENAGADRYPAPIVDHGKARDQALAAFARTKAGAS
jgi:deoxyribodipyrimidine photo-lyase